MNSVCAIVVTFHPDAQVLENLAAVRPQVAGLVVVDNGSTEAELTLLRAAVTQLDLQLVENGENLGIATALNVGVRWAQARGAQYVVLFDQDSRAGEGMVQALLDGFRASRWGDRLGILVPRYTDRRLGSAIRQNKAPVGIEAAMTSGSLMRVATFAEHGPFVDELFIDAVDYEYSLRLRRAGLVLEQAEDAVLLHSPGEPRQYKLFGRMIFQCANYSPLRHYYQQRNKVWVARRYLRDFPYFCGKLFYYSAKDFLKILAGESDKWNKCRFFLRGVLDGLRERMGRFTPG